MSRQDENFGAAGRRVAQHAAAPDPGGPADQPLQAAVYYEGIRLKRVLAYLIDVGIVVALGLAWWLAGFLFSLITLFAAWPLVVLGAALLPVAYHTWFIGGARSATPGMRALGIRVAVWNGRKPTYMQALIQTVLFYVTLSPSMGLVLLVSLLNERGRCLHDLLCGTVVVNVVDGPALSPAGRAA